MKAICLFALLAVFAGCSSEVPPGYVGMELAPSGLTGEALEPGRHPVWGRSELVLIERQEVTNTEPMQVLCADDLNFAFELKIRSRLRATDGRAIMDLLNRQGANLEGYRLDYDFLYATYVQPVAVSAARGIVGRYETTQIRQHRDEIAKAIQTQVTGALKGTPVEVLMVTTANFDYPDVITKAVEKKRAREIEIDEEKARQAMELLKADNRLKIAQKLRTVRAAEADAEAVYNRIMGKSLTTAYLQLKRIETDALLYQSAAPGDKVIVTDGSATPLIGVR